MATLIPATPIQGSPPEVIRLFNVMKRLPNEVVVCQRLPVLHGSGPDFCLIWSERLLFLTVSAATVLDVQRNQQPDLFGAQAKTIGVDEEKRLQFFLESVSEIGKLPGAVLFPNLPSRELKNARLSETSIQWVGKEHLSPDRFLVWLNGRLSPQLSPQKIDQIRVRFTPEVVVPSVFTVRQPKERDIEAKLDNYLLDYDQEHALKLDLNLTKAGHDTAKDFKLRLINGVAGSGKSLIVIYRAYMLRRLFSGKKILLLTHNRALIQDLRRRYARLSDGDRSVEMRTFMGWCRRHWPKDKPWRKLVRYRDRLDLVTQVWHEQLRDTAVSEQMLMDEIDWYKDRLLFSEEDYLSADRSGRGFALTESMRQKLFVAMQSYHQGLQKRQLMDWGDVPRQLWRLWHEGELTLPHYDIILVDEAQFFAPLWFEIIKRILTPQTGHLFLVADASQGFLKRKQSWLSSGLEVRGRVHRLTKSYRTTREILDFATLLYRRRLPDDDDDIVVPDVTNMPHGVLPVIIPLTSEQDEVTRVINEIKQLQASSVPWRDILIIHASREETSHITTRLNRVFGMNTAVDPGKDNPQDQIRVCSLNAATGLESPIVFLMGIHDLYEMEQSIRLSEEERAELVRDNTRKLYMAITRAGQRLVITYVGALPELFKAQNESSKAK